MSSRVVTVSSAVGAGADVIRDSTVDTGLPPTASGSVPGERSDGRARPVGCCNHPLVDIGLPPGGIEQRIVRWTPGQAAPLHHTHSVDVDVVLSGSIDLVLRDGTVRLDAGDVVTVDGVVHGWNAGPEGCVMSVTLIAR
ncbi:cupin domain-containing protein [Cryptosporangium sp. NPDC048952]|uniref:cupin domain-containing protein n=1 Tax=Cryptosporangium sp. NPDC048952 TaxID=3363961 RepID=UPI003721A246